MSVGKSSIKRVAAPTAEVKTAPEAPKAEAVAEKPGAKKAPVKKPAAKATPKATPKAAPKAPKTETKKPASKAKSGSVSITDDMPYYLL